MDFTILSENQGCLGWVRQVMLTHIQNHSCLLDSVSRSRLQLSLYPSSAFSVVFPHFPHTCLLHLHIPLSHMHFPAYRRDHPLLNPAPPPSRLLLRLHWGPRRFSALATAARNEQYHKDSVIPRIAQTLDRNLN